MPGTRCRNLPISWSNPANWIDWYITPSIRLPPPLVKNSYLAEAEGGGLAYMELLGQQEIRKKTGQIARISNIAYNTPQLHTGILPLGIALPVMPADSKFHDRYLTGLGQDILTIQVKRRITMEIAQAREAPEYSPEQDREGELGDISATMLDPGRGKEAGSQLFYRRS